MKKIKIAVDIDDCLCNTKDCDFNFAYINNRLRNKADEKFYEPGDFMVSRTFNMSKADEKEFFVKQKKYIMKHTAMYPHFFAKKVINTLRKEGYEIVLLTSRDSFFWSGNAKKYTRKWLKKYGFKYDELVTDTDDKLKYCKNNNIDVLVDDNPDFIAKANEGGLKTITFFQPYNKEYLHKLNKTASCWANVYEIITGKILIPNF